MKICFIGKYPPIEGGVSMQSYWIAYGLAERGHHIRFVTNANEVEASYRMHIMEDDASWYEPRFEPSGGFVKVRNSEPFSRGRMGHIPVANPFVTKLSSIATQIVMSQSCDLIYSSYFEPYGMAAYLASQWTGVPFVVQHAGSDLDRLMKVPDLSTAYKEMLKAAACVVTKRALTPRFLGMGIDPSRIEDNLVFGLRTSLFNPQAAPMDVNDFLRQIGDTHTRGAAGDSQWNPGPIDLTTPTIGIYGKVGVFKGSFDLISALSQLKKEGMQFNFLAMTQGVQLDSFKRCVLEAGIEDRTWILPFVPHWKVPGFIRACTAVCFLERDFPIAIHGPTVPREVMACGTCLIISKEIACKQVYRKEVADRINMIVVDDPKDHRELAAALKYVIEHPQDAREIAARGHEISKPLEDFSAYIDGYEGVVHRFSDTTQTSRKLREHSSQQKPTAEQRQVGRELRKEAGTVSDEVVVSALPYTSLLLADRLKSILEDFRRESKALNGNELKNAIAFCQLLTHLHSQERIPTECPYLGDMIKYESTDLGMLLEDSNRGMLPFYMGLDRLAGKEFSAENVEGLRPIKSNRLQIIEFDYDVQALIKALDRDPGSPPAADPKKTLILFQTFPNLTRLKLKINETTRQLLDACDGSKPCQQIVAEFADRQGVASPAARQDLSRKFYTTLKQLYDNGTIIFC